MKDGLGPAAVRRLAGALRRSDPSFDEAAFVRDACRGLAQLELKARVQHVIDSLERHLPENFPRALEIVVGAGEHRDSGDADDPLRGFAWWPLIDWVAQAGLHDFDRSMAALRRLTGLFSAEFAVRPFLERYPKRSLTLLTRWTRDDDANVRRLVSEGTRPRLPWGKHLQAFREDPGPTLELLELLKDDESEYVRRSVGNHLNDIGKDHPDLLLDVCRRWNRQASPERRWIIERATRSLVKAGHPGVFALLGHTTDPKVRLSELTVVPKRVRLGGAIEISFALGSKAARAQNLVVDYAIFHQKADGSTRPKVFKLKKLTLAAGGSAEIEKRHAFRAISARRYHAGEHAVEILVNGKALGRAGFVLTLPSAKA